MSNRIVDIVVRDYRLDPAESEIWITVVPKELTSSTQVHGRLMGPRCPYSTTVEVAYPLRETSREYESEGNKHLSHRVIIPEASFWEPQTPFLYEGPVELWQDEELCERVQLSHGLRVITLGPRGIRINGRPLMAQGIRGSQFSEEELINQHKAGCNLLLVPVSTQTLPLWDAADRLGFLMLGQIGDRETWELAGTLRQHPSCLGWVITTELMNHEILQAVRFSPLSFGRGHLVGCEIGLFPPGPLPDGIQFVVCEQKFLPALDEVPQPKIVLMSSAATGEVDLSGVLGCVYES
jgi:hypothetical protein